MLLIIEGGAVPIPLGEPARPVPAHRRPILEGYLRGFPPLHSVPALIPFDWQTRKVRELTFREALRLSHNHTATEHILLAPGKQATSYRKTIFETSRGRGSEP